MSITQKLPHPIFLEQQRKATQEKQNIYPSTNPFHSFISSRQNPLQSMTDHHPRQKTNLLPVHEHIKHIINSSALEQKHFRHHVFDQTEMIGSSFRGTDFSHSSFNHISLLGCDFSEAIMDKVSITLDLKYFDRKERIREGMNDRNMVPPNKGNLISSIVSIDPKYKDLREDLMAQWLKHLSHTLSPMPKDIFNGMNKILHEHGFSNSSHPDIRSFSINMLDLQHN